MKELNNIYLLAFLIIVIFFLSADSKIENIFKNNVYAMLISLLSIVFLIYNKINIQIFVIIIIGALYFTSDLKNRFNYEYFSSKFEGTSVKNLKEKLQNLTKMYNVGENENENEKDEQEENSVSNDKEDELKELFDEVDKDIENLKNI